jgi:Tfp pilus assembly protein PilZ
LNSWIPLSADTLQIRFDSPQALRSEFEKNIVNRGIFVPTETPFEVRQSVTVEVVLDYIDPPSEGLSLEGEIVHCVPVEMAGSGATPGVAVQFDVSATMLRERFEELLGRGLVVEGTGRRSAKRGAVRVPVRVMPAMSPPFETTSRDLSTSGILLTVKHDLPLIGEIVRVCLWHPSGDPSVEIDGKVVRQIPNKNGRIAAVAVAFDRQQAADPTANAVMEALRELGHRSRLGGIAGSLVDLGLVNMLQMFGASAPQGTLLVEREGEQGWIAFADGDLLGAELGVLSGMDALVSMMSWGDGHFQFEASADPELAESAPPWPLEGAILEAVCKLDEAGRESQGDGFGDPESVPGMGAADESDSLPINSTTTFEVDLEQEEISRDALDQTEEAVLDLAKAGMNVERLASVIPEPEAEVQAALEGLVELGVLVPR